MKTNHLPTARLAVCAILAFPCLAKAWEPGTYPVAPLRMATSGFFVNNQDRNDVVAFWHAIYQASEDYSTHVGWNGNYTGTNGTTSPEFVDDIERRLNYFRAMCGVSSDTTMNSGSKVVIGPSDAFKPAASTLKSTACQNAALMLIRNYTPSTGSDPALTHNPPAGLIGWSASAWNASAHGNFAFGVYGPGAITEYIVEELSGISSWNSLVGHRRWSLYPESTDFATGDQPGSSVLRPPTNVFYVIQHSSEPTTKAKVDFVSYPPAGFFPANINSKFWSLSRKGADFTFATVKMKDARGNSIPVSNVQRNNGYGDPAIIWQAAPAASVSTVTGDLPLSVNVTGIAGAGVPATYGYNVTLINPDVLLEDQKLTGPAFIPADDKGTYTFTPPEGAEAMQVAVFKKTNSNWKEDAEVAANAKIIDSTGDNYSLIVDPSTFVGFGSVSGTRSFRLTFPTSYDAITRGVPEQSFELDHDVIANAGAKINFKYRRGYMTTGSKLAFEASTDNGATWKAIGDPISGVSNTKFDSSVSSASLGLASSSEPVRLRFRYYTIGGAIYTQEAAPSVPTGIFVDDITTSHCDQLDKKKVNFLSGIAEKYVFSTKTTGITLVQNTTWQLKLRSKLGGHWFAYGPAKSVTITAP